MSILMVDNDPSSQTLSILLDDTTSDTERVARLLPLVYGQLRAVAERALATERPDHTLQATALVHEAYLRLVGDRDVHWSGKAHFYVAAAEAMRRILLDHARSRGRLKRGGGRARVDLQGVRFRNPGVRRAVPTLGERAPGGGRGRPPAFLRRADHRADRQGARTVVEHRRSTVGAGAGMVVPSDARPGQGPR
jgi:hypothetical protein